MERNINSSIHRLNHKFSFFSVMISFFLIANFLLIIIKSEEEVKTLSIISRHEKINNDPFLNEENLDINFQRLLKINKHWSINFQPDLLSHQVVDENYKTNVSNVLYSGKWNSNSSISEFSSQKGDMKFHIGLAYNLYSNQTYISISSKFFEDEFVDNWYFLKIIKGFYSIYDENIGVFDFESMNMKGDNFTIFIVHGSLFDKLSSTTECKANFNFVWDLENSSDTLQPPFINKIIGTIQTNPDCGTQLEIKFDLEKDSPIKDSLNYLIYSILICMICLLQMFSTILLNQKIVDSISNSNSISLISVGQNIIWNAYGCLCHFFLAVSNEDYVPYFGIPAFFYFTNFSIFELRLLYNLWKNQNINDLHDINEVRKKLIKFYITFYIFLFLSLFFVTKFYFEQVYIAIAVIVTWLPQIIHNIINKNRTSMPVINIVLNTINKIFIPIYFRGCPHNIFKVKTDIQFVYFILCIMAFEILFLYCQTLCGPTFFIPCKISSQSHIFYRSKDEIIGIKKEYEYSECTICLLPLFASEPLRKIMEQENHSGNAEAEHQVDNENRFCKKFLIKVNYIFLDFHEYQFFSKKPFILTQCMHAFHSSCLERWLRLKRECPTDRTVIPPIES